MLLPLLLLHQLPHQIQQSHQQILQLQEHAKLILTIMVSVCVSVTLASTNQVHLASKVLNAESTKSEKLTEPARVLKVSPTTTEYVLNVLPVLFTAQLPANVLLYVAKTLSFFQRAILVFVFKDTGWWEVSANNVPVDISSATDTVLLALSTQSIIVILKLAIVLLDSLLVNLAHALLNVQPTKSMTLICSVVSVFKVWEESMVLVLFVPLELNLLLMAQAATNVDRTNNLLMVSALACLATLWTQLKFVPFVQAYRMVSFLMVYAQFVLEQWSMME